MAKANKQWLCDITLHYITQLVLKFEMIITKLYKFVDFTSELLFNDLNFRILLKVRSSQTEIMEIIMC